MRTIGQHDGAKVALFIEHKLISILRDDIAGILYPNLWDLPGGGREADETPFETVSRELREELNLDLPPNAVLWESQFAANYKPNAWVAFFVAQLPVSALSDVVLGDEGQRWQLFDLDEFTALPNRVPSYGARLERWKQQTGGLVSLRG
ncbi:NUDIX hydrolase [Loktanella sp. S4079]|uniref:NUDIX hydrolase n=1 Tax=Loktanella sp. S4079 TaxID=579483 RepID=UPI0005FA06BD|nr:NUDIX hydrolase [Loktanella sp. S4079]KJZ21111.1 hypothetical protein TW80_00160 [Loktanella sp. S4079]